MSTHRSKSWSDHADQLIVSEQYAGKPELGIVFRIVQRTTGGSSRTVILKPDAVAELVDFVNSVMGGVNQ